MSTDLSRTSNIEQTRGRCNNCGDLFSNCGCRYNRTPDNKYLPSLQEVPKFRSYAETVNYELSLWERELKAKEQELIEREKKIREKEEYYKVLDHERLKGRHD